MMDIFISAKLDSLMVIMEVGRYPLKSFKVLFACSLSTEVTGIIKQYVVGGLCLGIVVASSKD